eukprot:scaffold297903_cov17-Tisochrysis_lutea.AAC.1
MLSYIPTWVDISMLSLQTKRKSQICIMTSYPHILNSSRFDEKRRSCCLQTNRAGARLLDLASNYKLIITTDRIGKDRVASGLADHHYWSLCNILAGPTTSSSLPVYLAPCDTVKSMFPTTISNFLFPGQLEGYYSQWCPDRAEDT